MRSKNDKYAQAVVDVLAADFVDLTADPAVAQALRRVLAAHSADPQQPFEWIVDEPIVANWRLKNDPRASGRVRLTCHKLYPSTADQELEDKVNARLTEL
jgi:hypothetical protein